MWLWKNSLLCLWLFANGFLYVTSIWGSIWLRFDFFLIFFFQIERILLYVHLYNHKLKALNIKNKGYLSSLSLPSLAAFETGFVPTQRTIHVTYSVFAVNHALTCMFYIFHTLPVISCQSVWMYGEIKLKLLKYWNLLNFIL